MKLFCETQKQLSLGTYFFANSECPSLRPTLCIYIPAIHHCALLIKIQQMYMHLKAPLSRFSFSRKSALKAISWSTPIPCKTFMQPLVHFVYLNGFGKYYLFEVLYVTLLNKLRQQMFGINSPSLLVYSV